MNIDEFGKHLTAYGKTIKNIEEFNNRINNSTIIPDHNNMIDRQCNVCDALFKVKSDEWKDIFKDEGVNCPYCNQKSVANDFTPKKYSQIVSDKISQILKNSIETGEEHNLESFIFEPDIDLQFHFKCKECHISYATVKKEIYCPNCGLKN